MRRKKERRTYILWIPSLPACPEERRERNAELAPFKKKGGGRIKTGPTGAQEKKKEGRAPYFCSVDATRKRGGGEEETFR